MEGLHSCSDDDLRALMRAEDAPTRLHATWALAARLGACSLRLVTEHERAEPSVGVRRHLIVVLSGLHHVDLLTTLSRDDPDHRIRATAAASLARRVRDDRTSVDAVVARLRDEHDPRVRTAIVEALPEVPPPAIEGALARVVAGPRDGLTKSAILERVVVREGHAAAIALLERRAPASACLRRALLARWFAVAPAHEVVGALGSARWRTVADALALVGRDALPWSVLAPLAERDEPRLDAAITRSADQRSAEHLPFFVTALERARATRVVEPACWALHAAISAAWLVRGPLAARALVACEGRLDRDDRIGRAARLLVGPLRCLMGTAGPAGWLGHPVARGGITRIDHADPVAVIVRAGSIEIGISHEDLDAVARALGPRSHSITAPLWHGGSVTLRPGELAHLARRPFLGEAVVFHELTTLAARGDAVEIRMERPELH